MGDKYERLHIANSIDALELILHHSNIDLSKMNEKRLVKNLNLLKNQISNKVLDQEETFILLRRYMSCYKRLLELDLRFGKIMCGTDFEKVEANYLETKKSLERRYAANIPATVIPNVKEKKEHVVPVPQRIFNNDYVTCENLFNALQGHYKILFVDARPDYDFSQSRFNNETCINVPDQCINAGLSANALGKKLEEHTREVWELRDSFDVIVLFDWNTDESSISSTKLGPLRAALVDWDFNRKYRERPVVLNGGYLSLLHTYPTLCTNPHVFLQQRNDELDELLAIDDIAYPSDADRSQSIVEVIPDTIHVEAGDDSVAKDTLIKENKQIILDRRTVVDQLVDVEKQWDQLNEMLTTDNSQSNTLNLKNQEMVITAERARLQKLYENLNDKQDDLRRKYDTSFDYNNSIDDTQNEELKEITTIEEDLSEKLKILEIVARDREEALKKARALKPKPVDAELKPKAPISEPNTAPVINRGIKPRLNNSISKSIVRPLDDMNNGHVGLRNIRNTCYMNTVLQCLRSVPVIKSLFCKGSYAKENIRNPAALIYETANLVRELWSSSDSWLEPAEFFLKIGALDPVYKRGQHEDCMEFFLFLLNHLSEDCIYVMKRPQIMTPRQAAWHSQFEGKGSIFIDLFYHQIRITQKCNICGKKTFKFEIESTFMLSVPEKDFDVQQLVREYMADYVIDEYLCSACGRPVTNKKELCLEPKVLVLVLKRYRQLVTGTGVHLKKIETKADFKVTNFRLARSNYKLTAIAMHAGNLNYGHYTAAVLTSRGWYEFNDETVRPINIKDDAVKTKACAFFYSICDE